MQKLKNAWRKTPRPARRVIVFIVGLACIAAGLFMLVLPGPGWATIFLGLAVLASEFDRAEKVHAGVTKRFRATLNRINRSGKH